MRVLIVGPSTTRTKGGMATIIADQLANKIINDRHELTYLVSHVEGNVCEKAYYSLKSLSYILVNRRKYDIIHFHTAADASFYRKSVLLRVSNWLNLKTIVHMHGADFDSFYLKRNSLLKKYIANSLTKSTRIVVLSDYWKNFFNREFKGLRLDVLKNGVDVKSYEPYIRKLTKIENYLFVGRLGERKGTYDLIKAIDIIVNTLGHAGLMFYLAGDGEIQKVEKLIVSKNLTGNVKLLGWLNDEQKRKQLEMAEVVLLPSYDENLPMALIEAMACGKIVISTYAGGIPDLIVPDVNGYLFEAGDIDKLVEYVLFVNKHPELMMKIGQNNIKTIAEKFNLDSLSLKLNSIYDTL
jgi:glycosyltransferase involved in cell wall biosynthesis